MHFLNNKTTTELPSEKRLVLSWFREILQDESFLRFVSLDCYLSSCGIKADNKTSDKQQKPYRGVKQVCSVLMTRNWSGS